MRAAGNDQVKKLPPGRHGLSRTSVLRNQHERIVAAVVEVVGAAGYAELTVEAIIGRAGVSRRTFYEHFRNREDVFLVAYDAATVQMIECVHHAYQAHEGFADRLRSALHALLEFLAERPMLARMCIVEALSAGPAAVERRDAAMGAFAAMIEENIRELLPACHDPSLTAETIVGGIYQVIYARVSRHETARLPELLAGLQCSILLPYIGQKAAESQCRELANPGLSA